MAAAPHAPSGARMRAEFRRRPLLRRAAERNRVPRRDAARAAAARRRARASSEQPLAQQPPGLPARRRGVEGVCARQYADAGLERLWHVLARHVVGDALRRHGACRCRRWCRWRRLPRFQRLCAHSLPPSSCPSSPRPPRPRSRAGGAFTTRATSLGWRRSKRCSRGSATASS